MSNRREGGHCATHKRNHQDGCLDCSLAREDALQQRLTAADEALDKAEDEFSLVSLEAGQRIDLLESLLRDVYNHNQLSLSDNQRIYAALKPAEGGGDD